MIQINPREVAAEAMVQILAEGAYNNTALRRLLRQNGAMSQQDRAFVTEIVNGTLRNIYYVDYVIDQFSNTKLNKIKPWLLAVLRTAVYQMLFMDVPDNAACNEAVKLATARGYKSLSGFVNGVLRAIGRGKTEIKLPEKGTAEYLSVVYSHPLWLVKMWVAYYGYEKTEALCQADNEAPDVTIRVNTLKTDAETLAKQLEEKGITVRQGSLWKDALHLSRTADLGRLAEFQEGLFHVQDESSQTAVAVFGVYFKLQSFVNMPASGLIQGMRPIVSYNYGAGNKDRIKQVMRASLNVVGAIMVVGTLLFIGFGRPIMEVFSQDQAMIAMGISALKIISISFVFSAFAIVLSGTFEAFGQGIYSLLITFLRQLVFVPLLAVGLSAAIGLDGIWLAFPAAELLGAVCAFIIGKKALFEKFFSKESKK